MNKFLATALFGLFSLCACAATTPPPKVVDAAPVEQCQGPTQASLVKAMTEHGLSMMADYKGAEAEAFNQFLKDHVVDKVPDTWDEIIVWSGEKIGVIVWFNQGCAVSHATGPYELVRPFIGQPV